MKIQQLILPFLLLSALFSVESKSLRKLQSNDAPPSPQPSPQKVAPSTTSAQQTDDPNDLGIRFSKIPFPDNAVPEGVTLPFTKSDYPFNNDLALLLQSTSIAHSIMAAGDYECRGNDANEWVELLGGRPSMPSRDSSSPYWHELCTVINAQELRRENRPASDFMVGLPSLWEGYTLADVADAVHRPVLGTHHAELLVSFNKAGLEVDGDILPNRGLRDFIGREIRFIDLLNWAIGAVAPVDFMLKWHVGRPRPEEIAWKIATNDLTHEDGVPKHIVERVKNLNLASAVNFTAFPEGSPPHPSWPAMHAASCATSLWLPTVAKLSDEQYCEILRLDYAVSVGRTVAGVHYPEDNIAGLNFAQQFIAKSLADHLAERYGSDPEKVLAKMEAYRFDWHTFDPENCTVVSGSHGLPCMQGLMTNGTS